MFQTPLGIQAGGRKRPLAALTALILPLLGVACEQLKSANPLSPLIAGPLAGVNLTTPTTVNPAEGARINYPDQPITLVFDNPTTTSPRPFTLTVQIAADVNFNTVVFSRSSLPPTQGPTTSLRLPDRLEPGRSYWWHVRAEDGANNSDWSGPTTFEALQPVVIGSPILKSPITNQRAGSTRPTLIVGNAPASGPHGPISYEFQIATSATVAAPFEDVTVSEGGPQTTYSVATTLAPDTTYYWRARAFDPQATSPWAPTEVFRTPVPVVVPTPTPTPTPGTGSCASSSGPAILVCVMAKYPSYMAAGVSLTQRQSNMAFLRDRVIEAGRCGGLDLVWNLKRGGPDISFDFIAWKKNGVVLGVDLAVGYDDTTHPLVLSWNDAGQFPTYGSYPTFSCSGV